MEMTEEQKARIVELANRVYRALRAARSCSFPSNEIAMLRHAANASAEAFRIAQGK